MGLSFDICHDLVTELLGERVENRVFGEVDDLVLAVFWGNFDFEDTFFKRLDNAKEIGVLFMDVLFRFSFQKILFSRNRQFDHAVLKGMNGMKTLLGLGPNSSRFYLRQLHLLTLVLFQRLDIIFIPQIILVLLVTSN